MNKRFIYIIVFAIAIAGLFIVQYQFLRVGLSLAKTQFQQKIDAAAMDLKQDLNYENELSFLIVESFDGSNYFKLEQDSLQLGSKYFLNDLIKRRLENNKINTDFTYRLYSNDSTINLQSPNSLKTGRESISYSIILEGYLPEALGKPLILQLKFQDLNSYFLSQLNGLLIPSILFMVIIIIVMAWVFKLFYKQGNLIMITNDFINNLTHELKTPIFSIGLAAKMLEDDIPDNKQQLLLQIRKQLDRLNLHVDQVLGLASIEHGAVLTFEEFDIRPDIKQWCLSFENQADLEKFSFKYELEAGPFNIKGSLFHLENVINNLLDNAKKYSHEPNIVLIAKKSEGFLKIDIKDNGKGISKKDQKKMFKKYYRVTEGDLHRTKGYGLGLSYVKEILKRHKGKITVDSELGKGSKFTILIPLYERQK